MPLLCDRPLPHTLDFVTARFVVGKVSGLNVNGLILSMGDEIPQGALTARALPQAYERPLRQIEEISFAFQCPDLRIICESRGTKYSAIPCTKAVAPVSATVGAVEQLALDDIPRRAVGPEDLERDELAELCRQNGLSDAGNRKVLLHRLKSLMGN
jgi:hypothetical protein